MELEEKIAVIDAYANTLSNAGSIVCREADLPYSKDVIAEVLIDEMKATAEPEVQAVLQEGFLRLELFLSDDDFERVGQYLEYLGELEDIDAELEEKFKLAAGKLPITDEEVDRVMAGIEQGLIERKAQIAAL